MSDQGGDDDRRGDPSGPSAPASAREPRGFLVRAREFVVGSEELREAPVTRFLVAVNVILFLLCVAHARSLGAVLKMPPDTMLLFGANLATLTVGDGRIESLVASCFLHFDLLHIGFNVMALRSVGPFVERSVGPARYFPLFLASGIVGSAASALVGWTTTERLSAGASGAICGVIAAAMILGYRTEGPKGPLTTAMARWLGLIVLLGFVARFDNAAHIGGAVAGVALAASWRRGYQYSRVGQRLVVGACLALLTASAGVLVGRNTSDPYLFMSVDGRLEAAANALAVGRCGEAREAASRALRLGRRDPVAVSVANRIITQCQGR